MSRRQFFLKVHGFDLFDVVFSILFKVEKIELRFYSGIHQKIYFKQGKCT